MRATKLLPTTQSSLRMESVSIKTSYLGCISNMMVSSPQAEEEKATGDLTEDGLKTLQQQEEMFRNLDVQYEMARSQTHTQRGMGLGFSSSFSRGMDAV